MLWPLLYYLSLLSSKVFEVFDKIQNLFILLTQNFISYDLALNLLFSRGYDTSGLGSIKRVIKLFWTQSICQMAYPYYG
jgi:hypothetical protein